MGIITGIRMTEQALSGTATNKRRANGKWGTVTKGVKRGSDDGRIINTVDGVSSQRERGRTVRFSKNMGVARCKFRWTVRSGSGATATGLFAVRAMAANSLSPRCSGITKKEVFSARPLRLQAFLLAATVGGQCLWAVTRPPGHEGRGYTQNALGSKQLRCRRVGGAGVVIVGNLSTLADTKHIVRR